MTDDLGRRRPTLPVVALEQAFDSVEVPALRDPERFRDQEGSLDYAAITRSPTSVRMVEGDDRTGRYRYEVYTR
jgi:hypothetical protein